MHKKPIGHSHAPIKLIAAITRIPTMKQISRQNDDGQLSPLTTGSNTAVPDY